MRGAPEESDATQQLSTAPCVVTNVASSASEVREVLFSSAAVGLKLTRKPKRLGSSCCFLLGSEEVAGRIFCLQPLVEWQEKKKGSFEGSLIQTSWTECQALPCPGESLSGASVEQVCLQCLLERLFPTLQRGVDLKAADFLPFLI